jgi:O-antigen ligase
MTALRLPQIRKIRATAIAGLGYALEFCRRITPPAALATMLIAAWGLGGATRANVHLLAIVELVALGCLALALLASAERRLPEQARWPLGLLGAFVAVACLQLVPLPWQAWSALPGRAPIAEGLELLELGGGFRPLSLAPEYTASAIIKFIPPVAVFVVALLMPWRTLVMTLCWTALVIAMASTAWGMAQVFDLAPQLYAWANDGVPSGPFANVNQHASLLMMFLPFIAASAGLARLKSLNGEGNIDIAILWASGGVIIVGAIALAGSLFAYMMAPFVIAASLMISSTGLRGLGWRTLAVGFMLSLVALGTVFLTVGLDQLGEVSEVDNSRSRSVIYEKTTEAIVDHAPLGTGLGTFDKVYPLYETPSVVPATFVNNAHNEYLQIAMEMGVPGVLIIAALVIWLLVEIGKVWLLKRDHGSLLRVKMAASVALCVPALHSLVDFPLRTSAAACFAATCLALLVVRRNSASAPTTDLSDQPGE